MYHTHRHVDWGDCDAAGIVFYPNYFRWMDSTFHQLGTALGFGHNDLPGMGVFATPLKDVGAQFSAPSRFGQRLAIAASVARLGTSSFQMRYRFTLEDRLIAEGHEDRVCVK